MRRLAIAIASLAAVNAQTNVDPRAADAEAAAARPLARLFVPAPDNAFRTAVSESSLPRVHRAVTGSPSAGADRENTATVRREGAWTYEIEPVAVSERDLRELQQIFSGERLLSPGNVVPCESFRPAFLIEWTSDGGKWLVHVGLDCQEADIRGPGVDMHRYLMPAAYGPLAAILSRYAR